MTNSADDDENEKLTDFLRLKYVVSLINISKQLFSVLINYNSLRTNGKDIQETEGKRRKKVFRKAGNGMVCCVSEGHDFCDVLRDKWLTDFQPDSTTDQTFAVVVVAAGVVVAVIEGRVAGAVVADGTAPVGT